MTNGSQRRLIAASNCHSCSIGVKPTTGDLEVFSDRPVFDFVKKKKQSGNKSKLTISSLLTGVV